MSEKYGERDTRIIKAILEGAGVKWTDEGWIVKGDLNLSKLGLSILPKIKSIGGSFDCSKNQLKYLEGAPEEVGGNFSCYDNKLISLEDGPKKVDGNYYCNNNELTSLIGAPERIYGDFVCNYNKLKSLKGISEKVDKNFWCYGNTKKFVEGDIRLVCEVSGLVKV